MLLSMALAIPAIAAIAAWCTPLLIEFPSRSPATAFVALTVLVASMLELIPVTLAVTRLIRNPETRELRSYVLTLLGMAALLPELAVYVIVMLE